LLFQSKTLGLSALIIDPNITVNSHGLPSDYPWVSKTTGEEFNEPEFRIILKGLDGLSE
tara:strand:+ start:12 stop:188 length:177 start_codon:yes stop_codon:yes gene_type:complete